MSSPSARRCPSPLTVAVFGPTGATGRFLVSELRAHPCVREVRAVARRPLPTPIVEGAVDGEVPSLSRPEGLAPLVEVWEGVDFESPDTYRRAVEGADAVFYALGTTRKDAGSSRDFVRIDKGFTLKAAELSKSLGVPHFLYVSAMNANPNSYFLYPRTKGEIEVALQGLGFPRLTIAHPGLLDRGNMTRWNEKLGWMFSWALPNIHCRDLARALIVDALTKKDGEGGQGLSTLSNSHLCLLAKDYLTSPQKHHGA